MILGIDCAGSRGGVALMDPEGAVWARDLGERGSHAESLIRSVLAVLEEAGVGWSEVARIAVAVGPGSFTGIRVGVAAARGFAQARDIPLTGVGSLDIHARACYDAMSLQTGGYIVSAVDVRRGEAVVSRFRVGASCPERAEEDRRVRVEEPGEAPPGNAVLSGDAASVLWPDGSMPRWVADGTERAVAAARLGAVDPVVDPTPRYFRPADARPRRG